MPMECRAIGLDYEVDPDPKNPSASRQYQVYDIGPDDTPNDVTLKILQTAPVFVTITVPNLPGDINSTITGQLFRINVSDLKFIDDSRAEATVKYGIVDAAPHPQVGGPDPSEKQPEELLGPEWAFDTQGGTIHITNLDTQNDRMRRRITIGSGGKGEAPETKGAIGVSRDRVEGCDIITGKLKLSLSLKNVPVSMNYIQKLTDLTGTINDGEFLNRQFAEVLFTGSTGSYRAGDGWVVNYDFLIGKTLPGVTIGNITINAEIFPFDHVWAAYADAETEGGLSQQPIGVYVDRVYELRDLSELFSV